MAIQVEITQTPPPSDWEVHVAEADLLAQQTMAQWAEPMFWLTVVSLTLSFGALITVFVSLRQTRAALRDTRTIGEVQNQAYVHAVEATYGQFDNIILKLRNSGGTPATHFAVSAVAKLVPVGQVSSSFEFPNTGFKQWSCLGANETLSASVDVPDPETIMRFKSAQCRPDELLLVSGTIVYCTIFNRDHETQFAFYAAPPSRARFRRPTSNLVSFHRCQTPNDRGWRRKYKTIWERS